MAIDFPNSPSAGANHTVDGKTWTYTDGKWALNVGVGGVQGPAGVAFQGTAPTTTDVLWADTSVSGVAVVPAGGTTGQMLAKASSTSYDTAWATPVTSADLALKAPLASPTFTGTPTLPTGTVATTQTAADSTTAIATTAFVTTADNLKANLASPTFTGTVSGVTKSMVGLGNVDNTSDATERAATATLTNKTLTTPVINSPTGILKGDVGLGNVDNTADTAKPVSTAQQTALDLKANLASPTFTGTVSASTVNSSNYQQGGNAGSIVRSGYSAAVTFATGGTNALVTMPAGCTIYNMIACHPVTGVNNTVEVTSIRYGDWSGVQTTNQVRITGYLGNGVHTEPFNIIFFWVA